MLSYFQLWEDALHLVCPHLVLHLVSQEEVQPEKSTWKWKNNKIEIISVKPTSNVLHCAGDKIWKRHSGNGGNPTACVLSGNSCWYLLSENEGRVKNRYGWYPGKVRCSAPYSAKNVLTYDTKNTKLLHNEILLKRYPFNTPTKTGECHYLKISMPLLKNDLFVFWID